MLFSTHVPIRAELVRLNVVPQKIGFWEVQLANAIKRAEFLDDFDAKQVSKGKQVTNKGTQAGHSPLCPEAHILYSGTFHIRLYRRRMSVPYKVSQTNTSSILVQSLLRQ